MYRHLRQSVVTHHLVANNTNSISDKEVIPTFVRKTISPPLSPSKILIHCLHGDRSIS